MSVRLFIPASAGPNDKGKGCVKTVFLSYMYIYIYIYIYIIIIYHYHYYNYVELRLVALVKAGL